MKRIIIILVAILFSLTARAQIDTNIFKYQRNQADGSFSGITNKDTFGGKAPGTIHGQLTYDLSQTAGRFYIEKEIDFSREGFVYNVSGEDTLRAASLEVNIPDNYLLDKISISNTPVLNVYGWAGNLPLKLQVDSTNPNTLMQICRYDTTSRNLILSLSSFFNAQSDSNNYQKIYTSFDYDNLIKRNYLYFCFVNVHTFFPAVNKMHIIFYFRRWI